MSSEERAVSTAALSGRPRAVLVLVTLVLLGRLSSVMTTASAAGSSGSACTLLCSSTAAAMPAASVSGGGDTRGTGEDRFTCSCVGTVSPSVSSAEFSDVGVSLRFPGTRRVEFAPLFSGGYSGRDAPVGLAFTLVDRVLIEEKRASDEF